MQRKHLQVVKRVRTASFRDSPVPIIFLQDDPLTAAKPQVKQKLRERGIYALADGREFVVHTVFRGGYVFYTPEDWERFGGHAYESNAAGQLRWNGEPDQWSTEELIDTSRTARSRSQKVA
jgi:hypothetical protein